MEALIGLVYTLHHHLNPAIVEQDAAAVVDLFG